MSGNIESCQIATEQGALDVSTTFTKDRDLVVVDKGSPVIEEAKKNKDVIILIRGKKWSVWTNIKNNFPLRILKTIGVAKSVFQGLGKLYGISWRRIKIVDMIDGWIDIDDWMPIGAGGRDSYDFLKRYKTYGTSFNYKKTGYWHKYSPRGWSDSTINNNIKEFINLYENIKKNGFKPIEDLPYAIDITSFPKIHKGLDGAQLNYYMAHGVHRTAICWALELKQIYVRLYKVKGI